MAVIGFGDLPEENWVVARWAFRGYLEHVRRSVAGVQDLEQCIEQAIALDGLHLTLLEEDVAVRLAPVLRRVAGEVASGKQRVSVEGRVLDEGSQRQFREAVAELESQIQHYQAARG